MTLRRTTRDRRTGHVSTKDFQKRCGSRIQSRCPACAKLYRGDAIQVLRSGLIDPDTKLPKLVTMLTLTAPGAERFGRTHVRHLSKKGKVQKCPCRSYHTADEAVLGTPVDPDTYNYDAAADFNAHASRLFAVTVQKLSRLLGRKVKVVRVVEFQARGLVHIHALVLGPITQRTLELVVSGGDNLRTGRKVAPATSGGWQWGQSCRADVVTGDSPGRAYAYLVKVINYSLKDTGRHECRGRAHAIRMAETAEKRCKCDKSIHDCHHGTHRATRTLRTVDTETGEIVSTTVEVNYQAKPAGYLCRRHRRAADGWGFRGHVLSKSRNWGTTFREVRAKRETWVAGQRQAAPDHLEVTWQRLPGSPNGRALTGSAPP